MEFLGLVVKNDRIALGLTQKQLQEMVNNKRGNPFGNYFISKIERGIAREVSVKDRRFLADLLNQPPDRYLGLETNPNKMILNLLQNQGMQDNIPSLERSIEFPAQYKQAGISILSYFSEVLTKKYPEDDVKVNILQEGNIVTLRVETPEGDVEKIERTLEEYGLVMSGKMALEAFTDDRELIRDLKTRLEITSLELRLRQDIHLEERKHSEKRISSLEQQVSELHKIVLSGLSNSTSLADTVRALIPVAGTQESIARSLETIAELSLADDSPENIDSLKRALGIVRNESPTIYERLVNNLQTIPVGILANIATPWVQNIIAALPK